ncbi:MAG: outer membrane beta-barrel protein [Proteobacteria bacterium]|nr:outer membrane beta-barrel protein [Pseudomonadota bacterium]
MFSKTENPSILILTVLTMVLNFILVCFVSPVNAEPNTTKKHDPYYVGLGLGLSFLQAKSSSTVFSIESNTDIAFNGVAGYQFDERWSTELSWSYLGKSAIHSIATGNVVGHLEYQSFGVGGRYHFPINESWKASATVGMGVLKNNFQSISNGNNGDSFVYAGLGVSWKMADSWDLRAEYDLYNSDVQVLFFKLIKRFGSAAENLLADTTPVIVKQKNCEGFNVKFEGITFAQGTSELSSKSKQSLDKLATQLLTLPEDIKFEIRAHADDVGTNASNYQLSLVRSRIVRDYLSKKGIALSRMDAQGYGEWYAKKGKTSPSARKDNRRAELVLIGLEKYVEDIRSCF